MENLTIRKMAKADLEKVAEVLAKAFASIGENWTQENGLRHVKESFFGDCHYVAVVDGQLVGMLLAIPLTKLKGTELFIDTVAVLPEHQRQGIGSKLLEQARKFAKKMTW